MSLGEVVTVTAPRALTRSTITKILDPRDFLGYDIVMISTGFAVVV
jgi:hypothetical protein